MKEEENENEKIIKYAKNLKILKKDANKNLNFVNKWVVLRGFNLYWYKSADSKKAEGLLELEPSVITDIISEEEKVEEKKEGEKNNIKMFQLQ